jgi:hypothetical protein
VGRGKRSSETTSTNKAPLINHHHVTNYVITHLGHCWPFSQVDRHERVMREIHELTDSSFLNLIQIKHVTGSTIVVETRGDLFKIRGQHT